MEPVLKSVIRDRANWAQRRYRPSHVIFEMSKLITILGLGYIAWMNHEYIVRFIGF